MQIKYLFQKLKGTRIYKPVMIAGLVGVSALLVWGSAKVAQNMSNSDDVYIPPVDIENSTQYELEDMYLSGNARNGTKVSILRDESDQVEATGYDNGTELIATGQDTTDMNLSNAASMDELEYNITKGILTELNRDMVNGSVSDDQLNQITNKYDVSINELQKMIEKYQKENTSDTTKIKSEIGMSEQQLKKLIEQLRTSVNTNIKSVDNKVTNAAAAANKASSDAATASNKAGTAQTTADKASQNATNAANSASAADKKASAASTAAEAADKKASAASTAAETADKNAKTASDKADKASAAVSDANKRIDNVEKTAGNVKGTYDSNTNTLTITFTK